jgi:DNA-binding NarL/FixJ family response regulator
MSGGDRFTGQSKWRDDVIRVVVCDDHALVRRRLVILLDGSPDISVLAEAADGERAVSLCRDLTPDVVIVGMHVEASGGPATAAAVREASPGARVAMLVARREEQDSVRSLKAGATGFVTREVIEVAPEVVRAVRQGRVIAPAMVIRRVLEEYVRLGRPSLSTLRLLEPPAIDPREQQILERLALGRSHSETAAELGLPEGITWNLAANAIEKLYRHARNEGVLGGAGERFESRP